jgi:hypothetical protein
MGQLTEAVRRKSYGAIPSFARLRLYLISSLAVILLDELEKAHKVAKSCPLLRYSCSRGSLRQFRHCHAPNAHRSIRARLRAVPTGTTESPRLDACLQPAFSRLRPTCGRPPPRRRCGAPCTAADQVGRRRCYEDMVSGEGLFGCLWCSRCCVRSTSLFALRCCSR